MIDDYNRAMALITRLKKELPVSATPTRRLIHSLRENGIKIKPRQIVQIESVMYLGDEGGIGCEIRWSQKQESPVIVSLTHIRVQNRNLLSEEIRAYQTERIKKLSRQ